MFWLELRPDILGITPVGTRTNLAKFSINSTNFNTQLIKFFPFAQSVMIQKIVQHPSQTIFVGGIGLEPTTSSV